ncbi:MAG: hypothetical protein R3B96_15285 [Pirellulaceae bacterium]
MGAGLDFPTIGFAGPGEAGKLDDDFGTLRVLPKSLRQVQLIDLAVAARWRSIASIERNGLIPLRLVPSYQRRSAAEEETRSALR